MNIIRQKQNEPTTVPKAYDMNEPKTYERVNEFDNTIYQFPRPQGFLPAYPWLLKPEAQAILKNEWNNVLNPNQ